MQSEQQVLITGCYRSGTEYATLLLNNHPAVTATMYVLNFMRFCHGRYDPVEEKQNYTRLVMDCAFRARVRWGRKVDVHAVLDACDNHGVVDYAFLYDLLMHDLFLKDGGSRWAEKTQLVWSRIPAFLDMFPNGRAIHIVRDPRSVLASFREYTYAAPPAYLGAVFCSLSSLQHAARYEEQRRDRYLLVRYEDLILDPVVTLDRMFSFLGLDSRAPLLSEQGWVNARGEPWIHNSAFHSRQQTAFDRAASVSRWTSHLAPWEVGFCEAVNAPLMDRFGYERTDADVDWIATTGYLLSDPSLTRYLRHWLETNEGIEEFPTDPLQSKNWQENAAPVSGP